MFVKNFFKVFFPSMILSLLLVVSEMLAGLHFEVFIGNKILFYLLMKVLYLLS